MRAHAELLALPVMLASLAIASLLPPLAARAAADLNAPCGALENGVLTRADVPLDLNVVACGLVGRKLDIGPVTLPIPAPSHGIGTAILRADGSVAGAIRTDANGDVAYESDPLGGSTTGEQWIDSDDATVDASRAVQTNGCDYSVYALKPFQLKSPHAYYIGSDGPQPAGQTVDDFAAASLNAVSAWESEQSPCFDTDKYSFPGYTYKGKDSRESDFDSAGECLTNHDSVNTIDAGNLAYGDVAAACIYFSSGYVDHADVQLNTEDYDFTYSPKSADCSNDWDVQSVLTHELGHIAGLAHVLVESGGKYQTMVRDGQPCTRFMRTLGRSDVLGMQAQY